MFYLDVLFRCSGCTPDVLYRCSGCTPLPPTHPQRPLCSLYCFHCPHSLLSFFYSPPTRRLKPLTLSLSPPPSHQTCLPLFSPARRLQHATLRAPPPPRPARHACSLARLSIPAHLRAGFSLPMPAHPHAGFSPPPSAHRRPRGPHGTPLGAGRLHAPGAPAAAAGLPPRDLSLTLALKAVGAEARRDSQVSARVAEWRAAFRCADDGGVACGKQQEQQQRRVRCTWRGGAGLRTVVDGLVRLVQAGARAV